jgi:hypothetical protein
MIGAIILGLVAGGIARVPAGLQCQAVWVG